MMSIGARLRRLIEDSGMTQTELAKKLGISLSTLNGYITDYREPDIHMLSQLAKELNISTDYLILGQASGNPSKNEYQDKVKVIAHNEGVTLTKAQEVAVAKFMRFLVSEDSGNDNDSN